MKRLASLVLALSVASAHAQSREPVPEYQLRLDPVARAVDARIELDLPEPTTIHLVFRLEWDAYEGLESRLASLDAWGEHGAVRIEPVSDGLGAGHHRIEIAGPDRITITYRMVLKPTAEPYFYHRVSQLSNDGGHLIGADLLPRIWLGEPHRKGHPALIRIGGLPRDWRVATVVPRSGIAYDVDDIRNAIFVVGSLRTRQTHLGPRSLTTAIYGDWPAFDDDVIDAVESVAGALHRIAGDGWGDGAHLVGVGRIPDRVSGLSTGGQVIGRTGLVYVGGTASNDIERTRFRHTTAHELTHWYVPTAFRFPGDAPSWFAEGFTDYLALKIQLATGLIEPQEFLDEIAVRLTRYRNSPLHGRISVAEAQADFWDDDAYRFIYDGGAAAAFLLDLGFQDRGRSLERALTEARRETQLTAQRLATVLSGGFRENAWIDAWVSDGTDPDWDIELNRYRLDWRNGSLVSLNGWATNALSSIRP
jgi:predicted metalloprotease with PDZ domain